MLVECLHMTSLKLCHYIHNYFSSHSHT